MAQPYEILADKLNNSMALTASLFHEMRQTIAFLSTKVEELSETIKNNEKEEYRLITIDEASKILGISTRTLMRRIKNGEIPTWKSNRAIRVSYNHIQELAKPKV